MNHATTPRPGRRQAGFSMLYMILVLVALSTLAASLTTLTRTGMETQLTETAIAQARYMALAGFNYIRQFKEDYTELEGRTFSFGNAGQFTISDVRDDPRMDTLMEARIVGSVNVGTAREANYVIFRLFNTEYPGAITFRDDFDDFHVQTSDPDKDPVVKNADKTFTIGNNENYAFGSMYYHGDKKLNWGQNVCNFSNATMSVGCDFKDGLRMFFVSHYATNNADGIVFTFFGTNSTSGGELNPYYQTPVEVCSSSECGEAIYAQASVGGESQHGEMIGYAGDGRVYDSTNGSNSCDSSGGKDVRFWLDPEQNGIQPPKFGVEFDNYPNTGTGSICADGTYCPARTSQRKDTSNDHISFVYWGDTNNDPFDCVLYHDPVENKYEDWDGNLSNAPGTATYDDNRHGAGNNPINGDWGYWPNSVGGTYPNFGWQNQPFAFRLEVERDIATGDYTLNAWVRKCTDTDLTDGPCREYFDRQYQSEHGTPEDKLYFSDTSKFLCGAGDEASGLCTANNVPDLHQAITLSSDMHDKFRKIIFGFTEATGGSYQTATYSEFILQFVKPNDYNSSGEKRRVINKTIQ